MSFFGYDTSLPRDRQNKAPGFGPTPDAFAGFGRDDADDGEVLNFDETYDGLGDELDEADDALNDDTFGASAAAETRHDADRDFSFEGRPAEPKPAPPMQPLQQPLRQSLQQPMQQYSQPQVLQRSSQPPAPAKPSRTGYERYKEPDFIPSLEASSSIWGPPAPKMPSHMSQKPSIEQPSRKMMSLEEVEAAMRAQKKPTPSPQPPLQHFQPPPPQQQQQQPTPPVQQQQQPPPPPRCTQPPQILQRPQELAETLPYRGVPQQSPRLPTSDLVEAVPQILQRPQSGHVNQHQPQEHRQDSSTGTLSQPRQILQNRDRAPRQDVAPRPALQAKEAPTQPNAAVMHTRGPSIGGRVITHPEQLLQMSESERTQYLEEDAKRAKRNYKIYLLSKDNGLMTPQDKNFITRIQLQQLVTATGNVDEAGPEAALAEDFYFQVFSQIRGAPKQNQNNHFAQTYLHQTGGRGNRRYPKGGDSHMRRMEQQVQRAVEAVKQKPKNKQLVIEGSLGKISFSNSKTPKPLLNLKRPESSEAPKPRAHTADSRKAALRSIEALYSVLLKMEDHERKMPPQPKEESSADEIQEHMDWRQRIQALNAELWQSMKILEPIDPNSSSPHPFIAIISHPKGKKLIPRVFRQIDDQQQLTVLTMIIFYLDTLDVIRNAIPPADGSPLSKAIRDDVESFSSSVMPSLFSYVQGADLNTLLGLMGLVLDRVRIPFVVRTKTGIEILTMFVSRGCIIKQNSQAPEADLQNWDSLYNRLFDILEPHLHSLFPGAIGSGEDKYVWQFLAAMGIGAGQEQQQRLVIAVKDRVMETVQYAKAIPEDQGAPLLNNVNLFMRAIGLDVELLG